MKIIKVVEKRQIYKFGSVNFWYMIYSKKLRNLQKKKSKVSLRFKVEGFYGFFFGVMKCWKSNRDFASSAKRDVIFPVISLSLISLLQLQNQKL
jgi:hypothetical protein